MIARLVKSKFLDEKPTQSVAAAAFIISLAGIASRVLGLLRDRILAGQFGAGDILDAYYAAFRIPDLVYSLLVLGALSAAFIPVFTELMAEKKEADAWKLSSGVLNLLVIFIGIVSLLLASSAPLVMKAVTPGFSADKTALAVTLTRIMFLSPLLLGISGIFGGVLVSFKKFLIYSLAPIFYNIGIIIGALFFVEFMGPVGLAWGVVLGASMHMLIQYPSVRFSGYRFHLDALRALRDKTVRKVMHLMVPRMLGIAVSQVNLTVITIFASTLAAGSLTAFNLANNIQSAPLGLFGVSFAIAVFPTLSAYAAKKENGELAGVFSRTLRQILFFIIPLSVFIFVLRAQIVRVVLGSGKFDWQDTIMTFQMLGFLAVSLFAQSLIPLLTRSFYAIQNTRHPFYIALVSEGVNILTVLLLIKKYQIFGLAIAFSLASVVNMILLAYFLKRKIPNIDGRLIADSTARIITASIIAGVAMQTAKYVVGTQGELDTFLEVLEQLVVAGLSGMAAFMLASYYLGVKEFFQFMDSVTQKLFGAKKVIQEDTGEVTGI